MEPTVRICATRQVEARSGWLLVVGPLEDFSAVNSPMLLNHCNANYFLLRYNASLSPKQRLGRPF